MKSCSSLMFVLFANSVAWPWWAVIWGYLTCTGFVESAATCTCTKAPTRFWLQFILLKPKDHCTDITFSHPVFLTHFLSGPSWFPLHPVLADVQRKTPYKGGRATLTVIGLDVALFPGVYHPGFSWLNPVKSFLFPRSIPSHVSVAICLGVGAGLLIHHVHKWLFCVDQMIKQVIKHPTQTSVLFSWLSECSYTL